MQNRPAIVAVGRTKFGEHYGKEPEKLIEEAWLAASNECNIERKDLRSMLHVGLFSSHHQQVGS